MLTKMETEKIKYIVQKTVKEFERVGIYLKTDGRTDIEAIEDACYKIINFDIKKYYLAEGPFETKALEESFRKMMQYQMIRKKGTVNFQLGLSIDYDTMDLDETTVRIDDDIQFIYRTQDEWEWMMEELDMTQDLKGFKMKRLFNPSEGDFIQVVSKFTREIREINRLVSADIEIWVRKTLMRMEKEIKETKIQFD